MSGRAETGTMKFGDDWTGVFLRGDDAFGYANALSDILNSTPAEDMRDVIARSMLTGLLDVLRASDERTADKDKVQTLQPFDQCLMK
jgi:hypothetical protein